MTTKKRSDSAREKYADPDYDDYEIDALLKYFQLDAYSDFVKFIRRRG